jgi:hypothetical protein
MLFKNTRGCAVPSYTLVSIPVATDSRLFFTLLTTSGFSVDERAGGALSGPGGPFMFQRRPWILAGAVKPAKHAHARAFKRVSKGRYATGFALLSSRRERWKASLKLAARVRSRLAAWLLIVAIAASLCTQVLLRLIAWLLIVATKAASLDIRK